MKTQTEQPTRRQLLLKRWNELKTQYHWQDIKKEWNKYAAWYLTKNNKELTCNLVTIEWFNKSWLSKNQTPPTKFLSLKGLEEGKIQFAERQKQACEQLLTDFGIEIGPETQELLKQACDSSEGLIKYTVQDWLKSEGNRPHPVTHPLTNKLYQLVLKHKSTI